MAACSAVFRGFILVLSMVSWSLAQNLAQHAPKRSETTLEKIQLSEISAVDVPSVPPESIAMPVLCDPWGTIVLRLAMPDTGVEDPISISSDGRSVIRFGRDKINDIVRPVPLSMFLGGSDVYVLTQGSRPEGQEAKWRTPNGEVITQRTSRSSMFVAHFRRDGSYAAAVSLDLPFKPLHLGVFENGDFLIAGMDRPSSEPRVAIVASNGQLRRFVQLVGDVHVEGESDKPGKDKDPTALPRSKPSTTLSESLFDVVATSQIARDGPNLLLFRPWNSPVFSISVSGEVRVHKLEVEGDYRVYTIKPTRSAWIVELMREIPSQGSAIEFATYAFDPESGAPVREYSFPRDLGFGLACIDGNEFTFVMANNEAKNLKLVRLRP